MTLAELLAAGRETDGAFGVPGSAPLTYAQVRVLVDTLAAKLRELGAGPDRPIAVSMINDPALVLAFLGTTRARAISAPLNPAYTRDEFRFYLDDIKPDRLILAPGATPAARDAANDLGIPVHDLTLEGTSLVFDGAELAPAPGPEAPYDDDVALFLHTSGTTSRPKGVPLTHNNLTTSARNIREWYGIGASDISYCVMPLFHIHGIVFSTLSMLLAGARIVIPERFSAGAFWPTVAAEHVTIVSAVPTIYRTLLLRAQEDAAPGPGEHSIRFLRSSSSALGATEMRRLEERFGVPVIEAYSMTEASHQMCANPLSGGERRPGSVGKGAFVQVAILDEAGAPIETGAIGEVCVRGANVTRGYHNNPDANAKAFTADGWFRTGDFGTMDADGYVTLVGRIKEMINRGGEKIAPVEVDEALLAHPAVAEAVAFGLPDEKYGEIVAAAVVARTPVAIDDLRAFVAERLASFKVPQTIFLTDAIPRTATGKVQRRNVAAAFATPTETAS